MIFAVSLIILAVIITPLAGYQLPAATPFMPAIFSASVLAEAITAFLLVSQFRTTNSTPLIYLGIAYAFASLTMLAYLLTYPGAFAEDGLLGAGPQTSGWIWLLWHYGFLLLVWRYLHSRSKFELADAARIRRFAVLVFGVTAFIIAATIVWRDVLPESLSAGHLAPLWRFVLGPGAIALALIDLYALHRLTKLLSVVDLWVAVAVIALAGDVYLTLIGEGRFSVGWYAARWEVLLAATLILVIFLYQIDHMYRELAQVTERLVEQALVDGLTEVSNRRAFDQHIKSALSMSARRNAPMAVVMMDIDHFKLYNDEFGHMGGDECLRRVAALIRDQLRRPSDFIARYGGEEFVAVLSDVDRPGALIVAEKVRAAVENARIPHSPRASRPHVTLSLGVCSMTATRMTKVAEIMEPADHALYRAKEQGRNRVMIADQESAVGDASAAT